MNFELSDEQRAILRCRAGGTNGGDQDPVDVRVELDSGAGLEAVRSRCTIPLELRQAVVERRVHDLADVGVGHHLGRPGDIRELCRARGPEGGEDGHTACPRNQGRGQDRNQHAGGREQEDACALGHKRGSSSRMNYTRWVS